MRFPKGPPPKPTHRINAQIRVREVRLVDVDGGMLGVTPTDEARKLAFQKGVDLVEVSPNARPPVCKLLDYGKFKYEEKKQKKESKKNQHVQVLKEVRLRPRTEEHDFMTKVNHARSFLEAGDKVLLTVFFKGRERAHKELGRVQMVRIKKELEDIAKVERDISMMGPRMQITLSPLPKSKQKPKSKADPASGPVETPAPDAPAPAPAPEPTKGEEHAEA